MPSELFRRTQPLEAEELRKHREDRWFVIGATFSISQMAFEGCTAEQLSGAKRFIDIMQNLQESPEAVKKMPPKTLDADNPGNFLVTPKPNEKKK